MDEVQQTNIYFYLNCAVEVRDHQFDDTRLDSQSASTKTSLTRLEITSPTSNNSGGPSNWPELCFLGPVHTC